MPRSRKVIAEDIRAELGRGESLLPEIEAELAAQCDLIPRLVIPTDTAQRARESRPLLRRLRASLPLELHSRFRLEYLDIILAGCERSRGPRKGFDQVKWLCAETARSLIEGFSNHPSEGARLHVITSLVWEYVTGCDEDVAKGENFKKMCDRVWRSWNRKHSYRIDRETGKVEDDPQPGDMSPREWNALVRARTPKP
jgi:hypothetical protein